MEGGSAHFPLDFALLVDTSNSCQNDASASNPGGGSDSKCSARIALASSTASTAVGAVVRDQHKGPCALLVGLAVAQALDDGLHHETLGGISQRQNAVNCHIDLLREHYCIVIKNRNNYLAPLVQCVVVSILESHGLFFLGQVPKKKLTVVLQNNETSAHGWHLNQPRLECVDDGLRCSGACGDVPLKD